MNDFSKEELMGLLWAYKMDSYYIDQKIDNFEQKIRVMIDNYCEHKNQSEELKEIT